MGLDLLRVIQTHEGNELNEGLCTYVATKVVLGAEAIFPSWTRR